MNGMTMPGGGKRRRAPSADMGDMTMPGGENSAGTVPGGAETMAMGQIGAAGVAKLRWHEAIMHATDASHIAELAGKNPHPSVKGLVPMGPAIGGKAKGFKPPKGPAI